MASDGFDPEVLRDAYDAIAPEYAAKFGGDLDQLDLDRALLDFAAAAALDRYGSLGLLLLKAPGQLAPRWAFGKTGHKHLD